MIDSARGNSTCIPDNAFRIYFSAVTFNKIEMISFEIFFIFKVLTTSADEKNVKKGKQGEKKSSDGFKK